MNLDIGSIVALAGLLLTVAGGVFKFGQQAQEIKDIKEDLCKLENHNAKQHEELYNSRNNTAEILAKLTALFESMKEKQESMDSKLDILIGRRSSDMRD